MLLVVEQIRKTFPGRPQPILENASLSVDAGEKVGIIGRSGEGKSTLARIIAGLEKADQGSVSFKGASKAFGKTPDNGNRDKRELHKAWLSMQMIFQNPEASFSSHMSIGDAVWEGAVYHPDLGSVAKSTRKRLVEEALDSVGLPKSVASKRAFELSGGQCQRAAIARAIIGNPELVICDEATSSLDVTVQARIMLLLEELCRSHGVAFLFITHNLPLTANFCDRVYRLESHTLTTCDL